MSAANITYVGHATLLIELDGVRILTDPLLRRYVGFLRRRWPLPDALRDVDAVLISHLHGDHLDLGSLERVGRDVRLIVPLGAGDYLRARHFHQVEEMEQGRFHPGWRSQDKSDARQSWRLPAALASADRSAWIRNRWIT